MPENSAAFTKPVVGAPTILYAGAWRSCAVSTQRIRDVARFARGSKMYRSCAAAFISLGVIASVSSPASAGFLMQIEQVIGGVNGDTSAQAIQLRMRLGDGDLSQERLRAWDASGQNPVTLIDFTGGVGSAAHGARVLIATEGFAGYLDTAVEADFLFENPIPESYLAAGRLTFESDAGEIYWSLAFGGSGYTGSTTGTLFNDPDGDFGPAVTGGLPMDDLAGLRFQGEFFASSTWNLADYGLTQGPAVFTNNGGASGAVVPEPAVILLLAGGAPFFLPRRPRRHADSH